MTRLAKPNCVKCILANKSDYFLKHFNKNSIVLGPFDSDDESDGNEDDANIKEDLLSQIGKYVVDEESKYMDDEDQDEDKTVNFTDDIRSKYGLKVFETSALLGTGLEEVFDYVTQELLVQNIPTDLSYAKNRALTSLAVEENYVDVGAKSMSVNLPGQAASVGKPKQQFLELESSVATYD